MVDVFISYSRKDRERCNAIREALTQLDVNVWSDVGIGAGSAFDREIERQIEDAKALLVLWSKDSVESDWVRNEARTGKVRDSLVAVQIDECELPLEFHSIQAELLPEGSEGTANTTWLNLLDRIGDILERPGLSEFARLSAEGDLDGWKRWLRGNASDPLAAGVIDKIVDFAMPDMRKQLASERAKRSALEVELTEHADNAKAQSTEIATSARELVRLRSDLEETRSGRQQAEIELEQFRAASGSKAGSDDSGLGIMLQDKQGLYVALLLWAFAITFSWGNLNDLLDGRGGLGDVFWLIFAIAALFFPAVVITGKLIRKRFATGRLGGNAQDES
ncbi:MAG: toll/interleukin-1 receptor domain-containing protein [Novosphingobium sp.]|nr:toll/interleukin-1 receptor domain-containing protein [Novosphingobium sp.]